MRSVTDGKTLHSMHSYFMRPADIGAEVRYEVEVLRDGRGYATRQVRGYQNGKPVYVCLASFAAGGAGRHLDATRRRRSFPAPTSCPRSAAYLDGRRRRHDDRGVAGLLVGRPQLRHAPRARPCLPRRRGRAGPAPGRVGSGRSTACGRSTGLTDEQRDLAALAYVCDYTILEPVLRVLGLAWAEPGLVTASLDHSMWFHRPGPVDGWLLYAQQAVAAGSGRGAAPSAASSPAIGTHLATVVQEGMIREPQEGAVMELSPSALRRHVRP